MWVVRCYGQKFTNENYMKELLTEFFSLILNEAPANKTSADTEQLVKFGQTSLDGQTIYVYGPSSAPEGQRSVATATYYAYKGQTKQKQAFTQQLKKKVQAQAKGKAEPKVAKRQPKAPSQQPAATKQPTQVSIGGKPTPLTDPDAIDAAKTIDRHLNSPDNDAIFGYIDDPKVRKTRARSLARLTAISADDTLSAEQKAKALQLEDGLRELLTLWSKGTKQSRQQAAKLAQQLNEQYKFFSNSSGISFKTVMFGNKHRHIVGKGTPRRNGEPSNLAAELVDIFKELGFDLRKAQQGDKALKDGLSKSSKPDLGEPVYGYERREGKGKNARVIPADPIVSKLFETMPFIEQKFRSIFGPTENGQLVDNTDGKNAEIYFRHSVETNNSTQKTEELLRKEGMVGMADAIARHRERMKNVLDNFNSMSLEERQSAVQQSYATMAVELHKPPTGDPELCGSIMKNLAELNLYDQELAAGKEVYMPHPGNFPGADKLIKVKDETKGERISGISVKYGKSGMVYGMPAQSNTITLFHPDSFYHDITTSRPGSEGFELGVRADCLEKNNWNKLMKGSGHGSVFTKVEAEALRIACQSAADLIAKNRGQKASNIRIRDVFGKAEKSKQAEAIGEILFGKPRSEERIAKIRQQFGDERTKILLKNPLAFAAILTVDSAIVTGEGFPQLMHVHQEISKEDGGDVQFRQNDPEAGSTNLDCWHYNFRSTDERGGGIIMGYNCGDH